MSEHDYIVVGGGAAGCAISARLATALPSQTVILLDAGGENDDPSQKTFGERHWTLTVPGYNWGYKTVPQTNLAGREIDYSRGKGLGGSTAINFCVYTRGPIADYDHWADLVGDQSWCWKNSAKRFKQIETLHQQSSQYEEFVAFSAATRGNDGPVDVSVPEAWDPSFGDFMRSSYFYHPKNVDHNSGDPIGIAVCQLSAHGRNRVTASGAYLSSPPSNLIIETGATISRIVIQDNKAIGVIANGRLITARKEVILAAGAIESPKLLLLSGIGQSDHLQGLGIPVVQNLPGVGRNLQDRLFLELVMVQEPGSHHRTSYIDSPSALEKARKQWTQDRSGPLAGYYLPQMIGYLKSENTIASQEYHTLSGATQELLRAKTKPHYEIVSQNPSPSVKAPEKYLSTAVAFPGNHRFGKLELRSRNSNDQPLIDPNFMTHPFDRRLAIESVRETLDFLHKPEMSKGSIRLAAGPAGDSDEEILKYVQDTAISMWHACGTVKMGKPGQDNACVDKDCKVIGVQNLRVADASVLPFLPSAHLQAVAYLIGETAAEKIIAACENAKP